MTFHSNVYYFAVLEQDLKQPLKKPAVLERKKAMDTHSPKLFNGCSWLLPEKAWPWRWPRAGPCPMARGAGQVVMVSPEGYLGGICS